MGNHITEYGMMSCIGSQMSPAHLTRFIPGTSEWRRLKVWRRTRLKMFLRSWLPGIFAPDYIPTRLSPEHTNDDVERIVRRDFPTAEFANVMAILSGYVARLNDNPATVRLAALRLANGNIPRLQALIESAKADYRDVVMPAVCPSYSQIGANLSGRKRRRIFESERQQYEDWLRR